MVPSQKIFENFLKRSENKVFATGTNVQNTLFEIFPLISWGLCTCPNTLFLDLKKMHWYLELIPK
jgi:hypothetical protein